MALSTLLRSSACMHRVLGTQTMRLVSQPAVLSSLFPRDTVTAPILNAVRSLRTSAVRCSAEKPHDHSKLWVIEKAVSALLLPLIPVALAFPNKALDSVIAVAIVAHTFWGFEAIAVDYVRPILVGPVVPKIAIGLVYAMCIATLGGLFYLIQHDIGIANTIRQFWSIKTQQH